MASRSGRYLTAQNVFQILGFGKKDETQPAVAREIEKQAPEYKDTPDYETRSKDLPECDRRKDTNYNKCRYLDSGSDSESIKNPFATDSESSEWLPSDNDDDDTDDNSNSVQVENMKMCADNFTTADGLTDTKHTETVSDSESENSTVSLVYPALSLKPSAEPQITTEKSGKKWSKKHHCLFCETYVIKIARHMERKHKNEIRVAQILTLPVRSRARREAWCQLLKEGDYAHNYNALKNGNELIIPKYGKATSCADQLIPCPNCKALYKKKYLSKHCAKCVDFNKDTNKRGYMSKKGKLLLPIPANTSKSFWNKVILSMNVDKICKNDTLILKYGERIFSKRDVEEHTPSNVSSRVRELGRLVNVVREKSHGTVQSLSDVLCATNFDLLLSCEGTGQLLG